MTAPVIAILDNGPSSLALTHAQLTDEGFRTLRRHTRPDPVILSAAPEPHDDVWALLTRPRGDVDTIRVPAIIAAHDRRPPRERVPLLCAMHCAIPWRPSLRDRLPTRFASLRGASPGRQRRSAPTPEHASTEGSDA